MFDWLINLKSLFLVVSASVFFRSVGKGAFVLHICNGLAERSGPCAGEAHPETRGTANVEDGCVVAIGTVRGARDIPKSMCARRCWNHSNGQIGDVVAGITAMGGDTRARSLSLFQPCLYQPTRPLYRQIHLFERYSLRIHRETF